MSASAVVCVASRLPQSDEVEANLVELIMGGEQVPRVSGEAVEEPHRHDVEASSAGLRHQEVEGRARVDGAGGALVVEFADLP